MKKWLDDFLPKDLLVIVKIALFTVSAVIFLYVLKFYSYDISEDSGDWGTFGDYVGGLLNPFLSFLALIVLLRTYSTQRKELEETQEILNEQKETQKRQQFESTFFELLKVHNQALESCQSDLQNLTENYRFLNLRDITSKNDYSKSIKTDINDRCGHYFRILYQLLKFIANSNDEINKAFDNQNIEYAVVSKNEKMYSNIVRALLTDDLMKVLSMNCYCEHGKDDIFWKYKLLIERYAFFEHASFAFEQESDYRFLENGLRPRWYYDEKAFGNQKSSQNQENP